MSADVREWTERISKVRKNVKKADDDLKNQMNAFLKVYVSDIILLNKLQFEKKYLSQWQELVSQKPRHNKHDARVIRHFPAFGSDLYHRG